MDEKLRELLEDINPQKMIDDVERDILNALNNFDIPKNKMDTEDECKDCLIDFMRSAWRSVLHNPTLFEGERDVMFGQVADYIKRDYDNLDIAYRFMFSGTEGGVYGVLKNLANSTARAMSENGIRTRVGEYLRSLSSEEQLESARDYVEEFKDILPSNIKNSPVMVFASFEKVLSDHPYMIRKHGNIG